MKKSEIYKMAQYAVLNSTMIGNHEKLEILRELMEREDMELHFESNEEGESK